MSIRKARPEDAAAIHELGRSVPEFAVTDTTIGFWPKETLDNAIMSDDVIVLVAEDSGQLQGFIIAAYNHGLRKAVVENVYVKPQNRGHGIGGQLLDELLKQLAGHECEFVATLVPLEANDAIARYEHAGFTKGKPFLWLDKPLSDSFKAES